jgi:CheY-like chemotaxis protein
LSWQVVDLLVTQGRRFDIILMDSMMKIMDGPDAIAAVRQHEWNTQQLHQVALLNPTP